MHFVRGADNSLTKVRKETLFIQILEDFETEMTFLINVKEKKLNNVYKRILTELVKRAFGWNDDFVKI